MLSVSYAGKNAYNAGKTSGVLRGGASGAYRCYVLAHCGGGGLKGAEKGSHNFLTLPSLNSALDNRKLNLLCSGFFFYKILRSVNVSKLALPLLGHTL